MYYLTVPKVILMGTHGQESLIQISKQMYIIYNIGIILCVCMSLLTCALNIFGITRKKVVKKKKKQYLGGGELGGWGPRLFSCFLNFMQTNALAIQKW